MTATLFKAYNNIIKQILLRHYNRPVTLSRSISVVEADKKETKDTETDIVRSKDFTRFRMRIKKRQLGDLDTNNTENTETGIEMLLQNKERVKLKKMALLLGYCGVDYYGMQRNAGVRTIEEDLLKALYQANYITETASENPQLVHFQRGSRTDKGVSAARQVVALNLPLELNVKKINEKLPECIKVFGVRRVTRKFDPQLRCNARTYSYTLPTYTFEPSLVTMEERKQYRIPEDKLEQVKKVLEIYKGTKNYHNFTRDIHFIDPAAWRVMKSFDVDRVFVEKDMEFAVLSVTGQSFMMHQIRKMVGLAVAVLRGRADISLLTEVFRREKISLPTAPGLGLVLEMVHYDIYNHKFHKSHDNLTWDEEKNDIEKFKQEHIYPIIVKGEVEENSMVTWLEKLHSHSYDPEEDVTKKDDQKQLLVDDDDTINKSDNKNNENIDLSSVSDVTSTENKNTK